MKKTLILLGFMLLSGILLDSALLAAPGANVPKIKNIRIRQTTDVGVGSYKMVIIVKNDDADEVANVDVEITPGTGSSPAPTTSQFTVAFKSENPEKNKKRYVNKTLNFEGPALGSSYTVTATMKDANGNPVGDVETQTVTVEVKDAPEITGVRIAENLSGYEVMAFVTDENDLVASVLAQITPVTLGAPVPSRSSLTLALDVVLPDETVRFANYGGLTFPSSALGFQYAVTLTPLDSEGNPLSAPVVISTIVVN